ncbi:hypothetical protein D8674_010492 [Pyrus ussuriensis x Pyrus communis]|uniref:Uncharacterized protein n=1 Tax=Pyrus ussuriensis x Pyrus communis TaxID=2448454 RepID=A0A5N5FEE3_9ROSA|nr:hypothetical protein D8674_010492 [Pyrus ussuriensis x Pyrus communis]
MNSLLRVLKFVMDPNRSPAYHFMAFPSSVAGNILHIKESRWLYEAIVFQYDIMWLEGLESLLKYLTLGCMNCSGGASQAKTLKRGSSS